jgi:hypothetical protein
MQCCAMWMLPMLAKVLELHQAQAKINRIPHPLHWSP